MCSDQRKAKNNLRKLLQHQRDLGQHFDTTEVLSQRQLDKHRKKWKSKEEASGDEDDDDAKNESIEITDNQRDALYHQLQCQDIMHVKPIHRPELVQRALSALNLYDLTATRVVKEYERDYKEVIKLMTKPDWTISRKSDLNFYQRCIVNYIHRTGAVYEVVKSSSTQS